MKFMKATEQHDLEDMYCGMELGKESLPFPSLVPGKNHARLQIYDAEVVFPEPSKVPPGLPTSPKFPDTYTTSTAE